MSIVIATKSADTFNTLKSAYDEIDRKAWEHVWTEHVRPNPWPDINGTLQQLWTERGGSFTTKDVEAGLVARGWVPQFCDDCEANAEAVSRGVNISIEGADTEVGDTEMDSDDDEVE